MKIYFATDHAGFALKENLVRYVQDVLGYTVHDCGAYESNPEDDYPEFIRIAAQAVSENPESARAIILGGSGQGEAMVANKFPHVRATVYYGGSRDIITLSREHNNANVLSLGARFVPEEEAQEAVALWLKSAFSEEARHARRIAQFEQL